MNSLKLRDKFVLNAICGRNNCLTLEEENYFEVNTVLVATEENDQKSLLRRLAFYYVIRYKCFLYYKCHNFLRKGDKNKTRMKDKNALLTN